MRISRQIGELTFKLNPKMLITTYEGHAWERATFGEVHKKAPEIVCVGYQHAPIFKMQHAIHRGLGRKFNPDYIWATGLNTKLALAQSSWIENRKITVIGTSRSLHYEKKLTSLEFETHKNLKIVCLVVPEGIMSECNTLFNFSVKCADSYPEIKFIWRLHPLVKDKMLRNKLFKRLGHNIKISTSSLMEDLKKCNCILYRGSSVAIQGSALGLRPIYYQLEEEMTLDPLYQVRDSFENVQSPEEFKKLVDSVKFWDAKKSQLVENHCNQIYEPYNLSEVYRFCENVIEKRSHSNGGLVNNAI